MAIVFFAPGRTVYAVVRVEENEETRSLDGFPDGIEGIVVQTFTDAFRTHDQTLFTEKRRQTCYLGVDGSEMWRKMLWRTYLQVRCGSDLGHTFEHFWDGDSGNEREEPETV